MKQSLLLALTCLVLLLSSCHTPNLAYLKEMQDNSALTLQEGYDLRFRVGDKLSIIVNSRDPELSALFNLPYISQTISANANNYNASNRGISAYTIDARGYIDFPVLGQIAVQGLQREEVAAYIKKELMQRNLVNDPVVTVEYAGLPFNVIGEVAKPGRYYFDRDRMTLLDALSMAGDLTINGKRDNIMVLRQEGDTQKSYRVNLQSAGEVFSSPAYYLQQNDIVYVEPTKKRERESTATGNTLHTPTFWLSLSSFLLTIGVLVFK